MPTTKKPKIIKARIGMPHEELKIRLALSSVKKIKNEMKMIEYVLKKQFKKSKLK